MNIPINSKTILFSALILSQSVANAGDIRLNGFASFVGGKVLKDNGNLFLADAGNATILGLPNNDASYDDDLSFRPDSSYGLKVYADIEEGLSVTAQVVGRGANDFDAEVEWAFLSYKLGNNFTLQAGRQRTPTFNYSSFLDVGYAYHWIRPPVTVYGNILSTYEGVSLGHKGSLGDWDTTTRLYAGAATNEQSRFGDFNADNLLGFEYKMANDWLQLRASSLKGDMSINSALSLTNEDSPVEAMFSGVSAIVTLGTGFFGVEATISQPLDSDDFIDTGLVQLDKQSAFMVTTGYRFGDFTPHLTYSESTVRQVGDVNPFFEGLKTGVESVTAGLRWDFHPSAAFKVEYTLNSDSSDEAITNLIGEINDVDALSFGFDIVF